MFMPILILIKMAYPNTDVVLLGFGRVARALAAMATRTGGGRIRVVAALDRSGYVFEPRGLTRTTTVRLQVR